jgi:hypothetical protein
VSFNMRQADIEGLPEIWCDLNASFSEAQFFSTCNGTRESLAKLGLTAETAIGTTFLFNGGDDPDPNGAPADIMFVGQFQHTEEFGIVIHMNEKGVFWRSHKDGSLRT